MKYSEALDELKTISQKLESENLDLDQIELLLARSGELATICRDSLRRVSDQLNEFQENQNEN